MREIVKEIRLNGGQIALVDDGDYLRLSQYRWFLHPKGYAHRHGLKSEGLRGKMVYMHREVFGFRNGDPEVDHINGNKLDNRRSNLKESTRSGNMSNTFHPHASASGWRGVSYTKGGRYVNRWRARIKVNKKEICLGHYATARMAALAVNEAALKHFGPQFRFFNQVFDLRYEPKHF